MIAQYPSDVLISLVDEQDIQETAARADGFQEILTVEHRLREDPVLLGCGLEIQFVAKKEEI